MNLWAAPPDKESLSLVPWLIVSWFHFPRNCWFRATNVTPMRCHTDMLEKGYYDWPSISSAKKTRNLSSMAQTQVWDRTLPDLQWPEMESPFFLTMVTNSKGPTSFLIMVTSGSITIWGQIRIWSEAEKFHPFGANPSNFPILNRASFRKGPFSFYSLPDYYL